MEEKKNTKEDTDNSMNDTTLTGDPSTESIPNENLSKESGDLLSETEDVVKFKAELSEQKDKYLRLLAEFDNYKRRSARENLEIRQTAGKEIITSLLDILDDSDRAEKQMQSTTDVEQIKEGVQLIFNKLRNMLQAKGLKAMESKGTEFDVEKHEAITEIPVDETERGKVADEIIKGYYLNDKLIRFAKVVVGK